MHNFPNLHSISINRQTPALQKVMIQFIDSIRLGLKTRAKA